MGERGSCGPSHPLDQPPTANPPPIVLTDTGADAPENSGPCPHWIECLGPLPAGLSEGVRDMGERSTPACLLILNVQRSTPFLVRRRCHFFSATRFRKAS